MPASPDKVFGVQRHDADRAEQGLASDRAQPPQATAVRRALTVARDRRARAE